jgi:hypothetical protein
MTGNRESKQRVMLSPRNETRANYEGCMHHRDSGSFISQVSDGKNDADNRGPC